ncbi:MAG: hypothetical protein ACLRXL_02180 [Christensenellaceae bacterium]
MKRECDGCGDIYIVSAIQTREPTYICPVCAKRRKQYGAPKYPKRVKIIDARYATWNRYGGLYIQ